MSIAQNYPVINPSLSLDFANTKKLDPRITFARASTARVYDGKTVAKAEENLLLRSQDYSATWVATNLTPVTGKTAPDATATATEFTASAGNATLTQSFTAVAGDYTFSVFLRRVTGTGDVDISAHSGGTWVTQTLTSTWTRFTVTQTLTAGARTPGIRVVTSGDAIEVWGAQIEFRASATAYTPTTTQPITNYIPVLQSAANNVARFDHNPVTGESLGLLVEEQRPNLLLRSEEFDDAAWTKTNATITPNTIVAPDGTLTGDKYIVNNGTSFGSDVLRQSTSKAASAITYTLSAFAKQGEFNRVQLFAQGSPGFAIVTFSLVDGSISSAATVSGGFANASANIVSVGNDWYRVSLTFTSDTHTSILSYVLARDSVATTGDGYSGIYIWGAQLEARASPTSYIPTVASQVTRSADAASMTGSNFFSWFRADESSFYAEADDLGIGSSANRHTIFSTANASDATKINVGKASGGGAANIVQWNEGSSSTVISAGTITANAFYKLAGTFKTNDFAVSFNGGAVSVNTSGVMDFSSSKLGIGSRIGGANTLNGHIRKLAYYPKRLSNTELVALTS
jgi:hypothetical protein